MCGLDSLKERSTLHVEFSRESVSFMARRTGGWEPAKMGRGGKGGKPGGSSKRVESGGIKGKLLLDARYFAIEKGLKRKRHEIRSESWEYKARGAGG